MLRYKLMGLIAFSLASILPAGFALAEDSHKDGKPETGASESTKSSSGKEEGEKGSGSGGGSSGTSSGGSSGSSSGSSTGSGHGSGGGSTSHGGGSSSQGGGNAGGESKSSSADNFIVRRGRTPAQMAALSAAATSPALNNDAVKQAVNDGRAVSMTMLFTFLDKNKAGQVIDVKLRSTQQGLVYDVKLLTNVILLNSVYLDAATLKPL